MCKIKTFIPVIIILFFLFIISCKIDNAPPGVIASINGEYIYLDEIEKKYDFIHFEYDEDFLNIAKVKKEYRNELMNLFLYKLIDQELKKRGLAVTDEEVQKEEEKIKSDYPPGEFEKILIEEYIDYDSWKKFLRIRLSINKFINTIIKPNIKINFKEVESYYKNHIKDFYIPNMISFTLFYCANKNILQEIRKNKLSIESIKNKYPEVIVHDYKLSLEQTPMLWKTALEFTQEGHFSKIKNDKKGFYLLKVNKKYSSKYLEPAQAYPLIERAILSKKINQYLYNWFIKSLRNAEIKINKSLLEG
ncbi:SurA N-terminal domain-containing protein [Desulfonauticus submarinus]|uniref:peptidylprolyl isomerase n=1 Tax=Desulfonauticus submarinus TaxID=206665 RepID=A0A1H0A3B0_9BACT|nr:SurA N-terminal domain-containing protein [Desulfonauticus submarinus]SDN28322.1 SurA N-terminal domain-containing protein [Desulfonauticus submarinus]